MATANTIVGGGLAGAKAAEAATQLRLQRAHPAHRRGEPRTLRRPPLSKAVLRGEAEPSSADVHDLDFYAAHDIELVTDKVTSLEHRRLQLAGERAVPFGAAGARWRTPCSCARPLLRPRGSP